MYLNELIEALDGAGLIIDDMGAVEKEIEALGHDPQVWVPEEDEEND